MSGRREPEPGCSLLVRNISRSVRADELRYAAEKYGRVRDVYIPKDYYTGESRGIGFVEFGDPMDADDAIRGLDRMVLEGKEISVVAARQGRKRPDDFRRGSGNYSAGYGGGRDRGYERGHDRGGYDRGSDRGGSRHDRDYDRDYDRGDQGSYRDEREEDYQGGGRSSRREREPSRSPRRRSYSRSYSRSPRDRSRSRERSRDRGYDGHAAPVVPEDAGPQELAAPQQPLA